MKALTEPKAEQLLSKYLPIAKSILTKKPEEAVKFAKTYPVMLKLISPQALHKTEVQGIRKADSEEELIKEFQDLISIAKKKKLKLEGILVQEHIKGAETIIGLKNDPTFGHVILFGIGGVFVEVLKDVSFRVCPITQQDAEEMINELKAKKLLLGFRGEKPVNLKILKNALVTASKIPEKHKDIEELDINPFIINDKTGKVADARLILR
ncbi:acetate--CoA ligase family protein [Candidatus Woesearchaeota archaeon]|nr:acetate--CoA ligase family protein [Candidatus Woesearchaeota archaeon]MBW3005268.1 acetate--CoA ligase family protein [Candidatus Woesearchaeota archaeon]